MFNLEDENISLTKVITIIITAVMMLILIGTVVLILAGFISNKYQLWASRMHGQQELARAEGNRKIAIQEAIAKKESASLLAEAEIIRAKGLAEANKIIGESLKNNESYLKYLWLDSLQHSNEKQIIYVPTEGNMPLLEATRLNK